MNRSAVPRRGAWRSLVLAVVVGGCVCISGTLLAQQPSGAAASQPGADAGARGAGARGGGARYPIPYRVVTPEQIAEVLDRIYTYVDASTPARIVNRTTGDPITNITGPNPDAIVEARPGFNITGYEWGVTYSGMIEAASATGDVKYKDYVDKRLTLISNSLKLNPPQAAAAAGAAGGRGAGGGRGGINLAGMLNPRSLDDSGSMCAGFIKARIAGVGPDLIDRINTYINWISTGQQRLSDGTLARSRPHNETLWLDDLYMSVPALAQMGKLTGDKKYYDDACRQILQFGQRMFVQDVGLWAHGWTARSDEHPAFHWGRANGWAAIAMAELLEVLPADHPQRADVMKLYKAHMKGLAKQQSSEGLWHQLLDRHDSYLETSCTAMFVYAMARGINRGWLDPFAYGPVAMLGWNGLSTKVNAQGQVEGTCVGTDLGFDYAFYYYRPTSVTAAHGYGPVLLAGAEMTRLVKNKQYIVNYDALNYVEPGYVPQGPGARGRGAARGAAQ